MADITIKKNLNIVFDADGFIVHSVPIEYEVYRSVAETLSSTVARMLNFGNMWPSTQAQAVLPAYIKVATMAARLEGKPYAIDNDEFLAELNSRTTLIKNGKTTPLDAALMTNIIDEELRDYIYGQLIFFILTSKREKGKSQEEWAESIGALTTSLTSTGYASSLTTSTEKDATT